jgi:hypothetical protein
MISFFKHFYAPKILWFKHIIKRIVLKFFKLNRLQNKSGLAFKTTGEKDNSYDSKNILVIKTLSAMNITYDSKKIYVLDFYGTGDSFLFYLYVNQFLKLRKKNITDLIVLTTRKNFNINKIFSDLNINCKIIPDEIGIKNLFYDYKADPFRDNFIIPHHRHIYGHESIVKFSSVEGFSDDLIMSVLILGTISAKKNYPKIKKYNDPFFTSNKKKKILIINESSSINSYSNEFWDLVVDLIKKNVDTDIYQNCFIGGSLKNIKRIEFSIHDLILRQHSFDLILTCQCGLGNILLETSTRNNIVFVAPELSQKNKFKFGPDLVIDNSYPFFYPEKFIAKHKRAVTIEVNMKNPKNGFNLIKLCLKFYLSGYYQQRRISDIKSFSNLGDIADKISILMIKSQRFKGVKSFDSFQELMTISPQTIKKVNYFDDYLFKDLLKINKQAWNLVDKIWEYKNNFSSLSTKDMKKVSEYIIESQAVNHKRVSTKNKLNIKLDPSGFIEHKNYRT